jgi:hypothetical protein
MFLILSLVSGCDKANTLKPIQPVKNQIIKSDDSQVSQPNNNQNIKTNLQKNPYCGWIPNNTQNIKTYFVPDDSSGWVAYANKDTYHKVIEVITVRGVVYRIIAVAVSPLVLYSIYRLCSFLYPYLHDFFKPSPSIILYRRKPLPPPVDIEIVD